MTHKRLINPFLLAGILMMLLIGAAGLAPITAHAQDFSVKIVHTNDIHARVEENAKSGIIGVERLKTIIDSYTGQAGTSGSLVLDSGDLFHGQPIATVVKGESIAQLANACGYDAMTAGNHDFSYGEAQLKVLAAHSGMPLLAGNVVDESGKPYFEPTTLVKTINVSGQSVKIGVFGVVDPKIYSATAPANVAGLTFTDMQTYSKLAVADLKSQGCTVIIGLTHCYDPATLASSVDGVNLWLAGHEHIDINKTVTTPDGGIACVVENGYYLGEVGLIDLQGQVDTAGKVTQVTCTPTRCDYQAATAYAKDPTITALLAKIKAEESNVLSQVVGKTPEALDGDWVHLRIGETNLGRVVTDAYLKETGADVAFENAGGIRASVPAGEVTYGNVIGVSPYGNYIVTKAVSGSELRSILETSLEIERQCIEANKTGQETGWPQASGSVLQVGGITAEYNLTLPEGKRIISLTVGGAPLDENKSYTIATNNFVAVSQYYPQLSGAPEIGEYAACDEALVSYFNQGEGAVAKTLAQKAMIPTDKTAEDEPAVTPEAPAETTAATALSIAPRTGVAPDEAPAALALALIAAAAALVAIQAARGRQH